MAEMKTEDGKKERYFLYYDGESVSGKVSSKNVQLRAESYNSMVFFLIHIIFLISIDLYRIIIFSSFSA